MSFSTACKDELIRIRIRQAEYRLAQLAGMTLTAGGIRISKSPALFYHTESQNVATHIAAIAASLYRIDTLIEEKRVEHRKRPFYEVTLSGEQAAELLHDTGAMRQTDSGPHLMTDLPDKLFLDEEIARAFLRGCFLGSGSCIDPKRGYHLEMIFRTESAADGAEQLLKAFRLHARQSVRKGGRRIVYLKEGDDVSGMLALIGANVAAMKLENVRVEKDMRNYINRTSNCETANLDKQVVASIRQRAAIRKIDELYGLRSLPASLQEAARLRMSHPDATVQELADLAEIQKSGMYHRLERLMKLAEGLKD